jgi:hypothetical protein
VLGVAWGTHRARLALLAESPMDAVQWTGGPWTPGAADAQKKAGKKAASKPEPEKPAED